MKDLDNIISVNGFIKQRNWCCGAKSVTVKQRKANERTNYLILGEKARGSNWCFPLIIVEFSIVDVTSSITLILPLIKVRGSLFTSAVHISPYKSMSTLL